MTKLFWFALIPLALAGCDSPDEAVTADPPAAVESVAAGGNPTPAGAVIPNTLIGVWDYERGSCDPASDMRLEVGQQEFVFYESVGKVTDVRSEGGATLVDLAMEGEGERWTQTLRLVLKDEGTRLHITEPQGDSEIDDYPRRRCPA